jgi:hypothetical protein
LLKLADLTTLEGFTALIGDKKLLEFKDSTTRLVSHAATVTKMLIFSKNANRFHHTFKSFKIQKVQLDEKPCGSMILSDKLDGEGIYSFVTWRDKPVRRVLKKEGFSKRWDMYTLNLTGKYEGFKQKYRERLAAERSVLQEYDRKGLCLDFNSTRASNSSIASIYKHPIFGVTLDQVLQWEERREAVEWVRRFPAAPSVYYEVKEDFNLLAIV